MGVSPATPSCWRRSPEAGRPRPGAGTRLTAPAEPPCLKRQGASSGQGRNLRDLELCLYFTKANKTHWISWSDKTTQNKLFHLDPFSLCSVLL